MVFISYPFLMAAITVLWILVRLSLCLRRKSLCLQREIQLILVYICIIVVARFTFFPFSNVNGQVQPLIFDVANAFPPRLNLRPFVHMTEYATRKETILNVFGNTAMFLPLGIVWPAVFRELNTYWKVIAAGVGTSLLIEILQLPFCDRVSDVDDLILNSLGFLMGYGIWLLVRHISMRRKS